MSADFDRYRDTYGDEVQRSIGFIGQDHAFFVESKARHLVDVADRHLDAGRSAAVLDVGCGVGLTHPYLTPTFATVCGADVSEGVVATARTANPVARYVVYDGARLPFADATFDLTFTIAVLHHVDPGAWAAFVSEMGRVTRPGGLLVIFEHNPFNPLTRLAVARCEFDAGVTLVRKRVAEDLVTRGGLDVVDTAYILFFPWRLPLARAIESRMRRLPAGAQYYVAARKSSRDGGASPTFARAHPREPRPRHASAEPTTRR